MELPIVKVEFMDGKIFTLESAEPPVGGRSPSISGSRIVENETTLAVYGAKIEWPEAARFETWHYFPRCNVRRYWQK